jgi:hypothetical protein
MVIGQGRRNGVVDILGLKSLGCLFMASFLILFVFIIGVVVLFDDDDATGAEMPTAGQSSVVTEALNIASHLVRPHLDAFDSSNTSPLLFPTKKYSDNYFPELYSFFSANHVGGEPANNVQCVAFVKATYHMAGLPLPSEQNPLPNASDYWYQTNGWPDWKHIPNGQALPSPGDIIVLEHPGNPGHVSIVVSVLPPKDGETQGKIIVAQGNAGFTTQTTQNDPRIPGLNVPAGIPLSVLPYNPATNYVDSTWSSYTVLGFLHNTKLDNQTEQATNPQQG